MNKDKKFTCIVKLGDNRFLKYKYVSNLISFTRFLDKQYSNWRYFNVYDIKTRSQVGSFTKNNRPNNKTII